MGEANSSQYLGTNEMAVSIHFRDHPSLLLFHATRIQKFIYYINVSLAHTPPCPARTPDSFNGIQEYSRLIRITMP
jgi:hypothetical protein